MNQLSQSCGRYISHVIELDGIYIHTYNADARIRVWNDNVIQIHISIKDKADFFSYAVNSTPSKTRFSVHESKKVLTLKTKKITLLITKFPLRFTFHNEKGKLINEDDAAFGTSWIGNEMTTYKSLQSGERFIGLGEKTRNLDRRGEAFVNWNTDAFGYNSWTDPLYMSTPFYIGIHNKLVYGIFLDNSHKSKFNFGASNNRFSSFSVENGDMNYYFIYHDNVMDLIRSYTELTGRMPLPPKWALGYQQCRYSYYPDTEIQEISKAFRDKKIPCDVIYFDIHYMDDYKLFTWNRERFPQPEKLIRQLKKDGFRIIAIVDPGIKKDKAYPVFNEGLNNDVFVKYPDGQEYSANVWPGESCFPDFTKESCRKWWGTQISSLVDTGLEGFWLDMNEPASWGQDTPDLLEFDYEGQKVSHKKARNVYGMQMARATYESAGKLLRNKRCFVLTRAGFSGIQRYAAVWTGDNSANDESMMVGVRMISSLGLCGIPFAGFDVGGFIGDTSADLYKRWVAIGAFTPFFRGHTMVNTKRSEPWAYGEESEEVARNYISLRYRLMPYIYSLFHKASEDGTPVSRTLAINHPFDDNVFNPEFQNQFKFGPAFLVCPVESYREFKTIYLPEGEWYDLYTDDIFGGLNAYTSKTPHYKLPVFVKGSSVIPMQEQTQHAEDPAGPILSVHIYNGKETTDFEYYEDDGKSRNYIKGEFLKRTINFNPKKKKITFRKTVGKYKSSFSQLKIFLHGFPRLKNVSVNGKGEKIHQTDFRFIDPISNFDPFYPGKKESEQIRELPFIKIRNLRRAIEINYSWQM